jgi:hypothetical protein
MKMSIIRKGVILAACLTAVAAWTVTSKAASQSFNDIIVKQRGGSIEVDTQPGVFTEFRIVLPRASASLIKSGERT